MTAITRRTLELNSIRIHIAEVGQGPLAGLNETAHLCP